MKTNPWALVPLFALACSSDIPAAFRCGTDEWHEAPYSPVDMTKYPNTLGCWRVTTTESGGLADHPIDACADAARCIIVPAGAKVYAYGRSGGETVEFDAVQATCDEVCP